MAFHCSPTQTDVADETTFLRKLYSMEWMAIQHKHHQLWGPVNVLTATPGASQPPPASKNSNKSFFTALKCRLKTESPSLFEIYSECCCPPQCRPTRAPRPGFSCDNIHIQNFLPDITQRSIVTSAQIVRMVDGGPIHHTRLRGTNQSHEASAPTPPPPCHHPTVVQPPCPYCEWLSMRD